MKHIFTLLTILGAFNAANAAEQLQNPKVILQLNDGTRWPLKQREFNRMGSVKNLLDTQDTTQETDEPLEIPLDAHLVTPEAGTLLMHLMENVLSDENYENIPEIEAINSNKKIVEKQLNWLTDKRRLASNVHRFDLLKELYCAADYLNIQLLKTETQNIDHQTVADYKLQELIAHEAANSLIASDFGSVDLNINHNGLHEQLKLEMAQRYTHNKVLVNEVLVNGHQEHIWNPQLSPNGNILITHSFDKVMVHDVQSGDVLYVVTRGDAHGHQKHIYDAQLSTDGNILMTQSYDKVMVHNIQTGALLFSVAKGAANGHQNDILDAQLSADGTTLMTQSHDKVMVCNTQTRAVLFTVDRGDAHGHQEWIVGAQLSPNGNILMTYSFDKVMVHDVQSGDVLYVVTRGDAHGHQEHILRTQLSTDGNILMTHSYDKVMVHNTQTGALLFSVAKGAANGHQEWILDAQLCADGTTLMTRSFDKVMRHNLPITVHLRQKPLSKFIPKTNNNNKTVSIYQQGFTEELARDLSLEQI